MTTKLAREMSVAEATNEQLNMEVELHNMALKLAEMKLCAMGIRNYGAIWFNEVRILNEETVELEPKTRIAYIDQFNNHIVYSHDGTLADFLNINI